MEKVIVCRKCGQPAALIENKPDHPAMSPSVLCTCWSKMCGNFGLTTDMRDADLFNARFTFQDADETAANWKLDLLQWRAESLARLATFTRNEQRGQSHQDAAPLTNQTI